MKKLLLLPLALILFAAPMADDILVESFEGGMPSGWDIWNEGDPGFDWDFGNYAGYAHEGTWYAFCYYAYYDVDSWLVTPTLDMSGYENLEVTCWYFAVWPSYYSYTGLMGTDVASPDPGDFDELEEFGGASVYTEFVVDATAYDGESDVTFAFHYDGYGAHNAILDDITITGDVVPAVESASLGEIKAIYR